MSASDASSRYSVARLPVLLALIIGAVLLSPARGDAYSPGQLYAFGDNEQGQLGNPTNNDRLVANPTPTPVTLSGSSGPVVQVAAGGSFSMALTSTGQLYAFGDNTYGELGNSTNNEDFFAANPTPTPVGLPGTSSPIAEVAGGLSHTLAVTSAGELYAFGENAFGQLGTTANNHTETPNPIPALVTLPGEAGPVTDVTAGGYHSLALTSTGQLYAFGDNAFGELGTATNDDQDPHYTGANPTPAVVTLPGATGPVTAVAGGAFFSLAVTSTGQLYAFGENRYGQLGSTTNNQTGEPTPTPALVTLPGASGPVTQVAAGRNHGLALTSTGQLYAFGENRLGQLGNTTNNRSEAPNPTPTPVTIPNMSGRIIRIAAGNNYSLALTSTGQLYAFGGDPFGELGTSPPPAGTPQPTPMPIDLPTNVEALATGCCSDHTLAVLADLIITNTSLPAGEIGAAYTAELQGTGGSQPYKWAGSDLPPGLSIEQATGRITGVPTAAGAYASTVTITDNKGIEALTPLTITIKAPQPQPSNPTPSPPPQPVEILPTPSIQHASQSNRRWRENRNHGHGHNKTPIGTIFSFSLNENATVSFNFLKLPHNRQSYRTRNRDISCPAKAGELVYIGHTGTNHMPFAGWLSHAKTLQPGHYKVIIRATNSSGQRSTPLTLSFTITR